MATGLRPDRPASHGLRLFFYGTLLAGSGNPVAQRVHAKLRTLGAARVKGRLFAIGDEGGWYPALVAGEGLVSGVIHEALPAFSASDLAALDGYEGKEYRRSAIDSGVAGMVEAYLWAGPVPEGAVPIAGGDFAAWLAETGRIAWSA